MAREWSPGPYVSFVSLRLTSGGSERVLIAVNHRGMGPEAVIDPPLTQVMLSLSAAGAKSAVPSEGE